MSPGIKLDENQCFGGFWSFKKKSDVYDKPKSFITLASSAPLGRARNCNWNGTYLF